jgi:hypothetical protein
MVMLVIFMMMGALLMGNLVQGYLEERTGHWERGWKPAFNP